jgi:hypothetical protein
VAADDPDRGQPDLAGLVARRTKEYLRLWEGAATKLRSSSYRSEDLLEDWFAFLGIAARDMTAAATLCWRPAAWTGRGPDAEPDDGQPDEAR